MRLFLTFAVLGALSGCADFPQLDAVVSDRAKAAEYPRLLPMDVLLAQIPPVRPGVAAETLASRAAALQARAARLRAPVVDPATRARLAAALARHNR